MKLSKISPVHYTIILSCINCFMVFIWLFLYSEKIKLSYVTMIFIITLLLIINLTALVIAITNKNSIKEREYTLEMYEAIIEASPNAIFIHRKLKFIYANSKVKELFDLEDSSELIGNPVEDFINLNKDVIGPARLENALNETEFEPLVEEVLFMKNGRKIELEILSTPIKINNIICVLNLCKNITEKKRIAELEKKIELEEKKLRASIELDKLKEDFFANLSHELRTPLTIILGTIQLLEINSKSQESDLDKIYKVIKQNCYRLLKLVNNLLDITKIDAGYFSIRTGKYNIISIVEDSALSVINYVESNGLNIIFDTNIEEKIISCDVDSIERIMLNLLSNAIKFTPKGGTIFVNVIVEDNSVKISVKDTGIGIKKDHLDLIFDRFRQVDKSFTRNHEGSGIGLSLVKSLVEMNGGSISLLSEYGKGSKFTIEFFTENVEISQDVDKTIETENFIYEKINIELSDLLAKT
ncbi:ATP-binding protein [Clostridium sp.]|jgi:PAS domain S-box-containing protein|uniref:ATP-binding protein n=1 Tax=Clostridium sp. TaxID=1506 RepID=UPI003EECB4C6